MNMENKEIKKHKKANTAKTVSQKEIAQEIYRKLKGKVLLKDIEEIIAMEQEINVGYLKKLTKVSKNDYIHFVPKMIPKKVWISPLDNKEYVIPKHVDVSVRLGKAMKEKLIIHKEAKQCIPL